VLKLHPEECLLNPVKTSREWQFAVGYGGWFRADNPTLPGPLYLRISRQGDGRYQITELYLDGRGKPLTAGLLRGVPLAQLESELVVRTADPYGVDMAEAFPERAGVDLSVLASYFGSAIQHDLGDADHWIAQSLREHGQVPYASDPFPTPRRKKIRPLSIPEDGRLSPDFLGRVAEAYTAAVAAGDTHPAVTLAAQAGVSPNTVRRWIYLARKGGKLPPGRQGRIG
jgi:hypothetical protein